MGRVENAAVVGAAFLHLPQRSFAASLNCATVAYTNEPCVIRGLGSRKGTFAGGVADQRKLHDGDVVEIGSVRLVYRRAPGTIDDHRNALTRNQKNTGNPAYLPDPSSAICWT